MIVWSVVLTLALLGAMFAILFLCYLYEREELRTRMLEEEKRKERSFPVFPKIMGKLNNGHLVWGMLFKAPNGNLVWEGKDGNWFSLGKNGRVYRMSMTEEHAQEYPDGDSGLEEALEIFERANLEARVAQVKFGGSF